MIDEEVSRILHEAADRRQQLLAQHRDKLDAVAHALEENEVLDDVEVAELIGPSAYRPKVASNGKPHDESTAPAGSESVSKA